MLHASGDAVERAARMQAEKESSQANLFELGLTDQASPLHESAFELPEVEEWSLPVRLDYEKETLGFYLTGHPLKEYEEELSRVGVLSTRDLLDAGDGNEVSISFNRMFPLFRLLMIVFKASRSKMSCKHSRNVSMVTGNSECRLTTCSRSDARRRCSHKGILLPGCERGSMRARAEL